MVDDFIENVKEFFTSNIGAYLNNLYDNPLSLILLLIDLAIVIFLACKLVKVAKNSRAWQLLKGIVLLIVATFVSDIIGLKILHWILDAIMNWGVLALIVIFQPEIRRA